MTRSRWDETRALKLWRERELQFPPRVRRMTPDALDFASGAWDRMRALIEAGWDSGWGATDPYRSVQTATDWAEVKQAQHDGSRQIYGDAGKFMRGGEPG